MYTALPSLSCLILFFVSLVLFSPSESHAHIADTGDTKLERISTATRADGLGYVIRFHFSAAPDSFKIIQPSEHLVQVAFYKNNVVHETDRIQYPSPFTGLTNSTIPGGFGVNISLDADNTAYRAQAYIDQNNRHVLIGFTEVSKREIALLTDGISPVDWTKLNRVSEAEPLEAIVPPDSLISEGLDELLSGSGEDAWDSALVAPHQINRSAIRFDTIILDPGHGGTDPGAIGTSGIYEKTIALAVSKKVGAYINEYMPELKVVFTREDDTFIGLAERGRIANRKEGNLFVSIHTNSHTGRQANGAEFYFLGIGRSSSALHVMRRENSVLRFEEDTEATTELTEQQLMIYELQNAGNMAMSQHFGELLNHQFSQRAQRRSRGVKQAGLQVLFEASMPGVLIELGFISNPTEERFMKSEYGQTILASAIFRAIRDYKESFERAGRDRNSH